METKELTALEMLVDRMQSASNAAAAGKATEKGIAYQRGKAAAFNEAHTLMKDELRRLCNLFQNGALSVADFGVIL
jgi:hypothetical protein